MFSPACALVGARPTSSALDCLEDSGFLLPSSPLQHTPLNSQGRPMSCVIHGPFPLRLKLTQVTSHAQRKTDCIPSRLPLPHLLCVEFLPVCPFSTLNTPRPGLSGCCLWHTRVLHFSFWLCLFLLPLLQDFPFSLATWTNACHTRSPLLSMASYFRQKMLSFSLTLGLLKATPSISTAGGGEQNLYLNY